MKNYFIHLLILFSIISCAPKLTTHIFEPYKNAKAKIGEGNNEVKAKEFEKIYNQYSKHKEFEKSLFVFLSESDNLQDYYWIGGFFLTPDYQYTKIENFELASSVLEIGILDVNSRISISDDVEKIENLKHDRCGLYYAMSLLLYKKDNISKSKDFFLKAANEKDVNCGAFFPAMSPEDRESYFKVLDLE